MATKREPRTPSGARAGNAQHKLEEQELQRARADLEEQAASYRSVFEAGSEGYLVHDQGIIIEANPQFEEIVGYKSSELVGLSLMKLVAEESKALVAERLRTRPGKPFEIVGLRRDGTRVQVEIVGKRHLHKGKEVGLVTVRDITQRKQAEEALRESEHMFRLVAQNVAEVLWLVNPTDYEVTYASPSYEELWGRTCESLYADSLSWLAAVHPDDSDQVSAAFERQAETGEFDEEFRIVRPDGSVRWVWDRGFAVKNESGQVTHIVGLANDITERKQAEEALRESEERYRDYYDQAPDAYLSVDPESGLIIDCNQTTADLLHRRKDELIGHPVFEFYVPEALERVQAALQELQARGVLRGVELQLRRKDGEVIDVSLDATAIRDESGRVLRSRSTWRDITEHKEAEEALHQSREELEAKVEADMLRGNAYGLTFRELTVLHLVAAGRADKEIASELGIRPHTASRHVKNLMSKMDATSRTDAGVRAVREELIT